MSMRSKCSKFALVFATEWGIPMSMLMETGKLLINLKGTVMFSFTGLNNWTKQNQFTRHVSCNSPRLVIIITHDCKLYCLPPALSFGGQASVLRPRSSHSEVCKSRHKSSSLHCQTSGSNDHNNVWEALCYVQWQEGPGSAAQAKNTGNLLYTQYPHWTQEIIPLKKTNVCQRCLACKTCSAQIPPGVLIIA